MIYLQLKLIELLFIIKRNYIFFMASIARRNRFDYWYNKFIYLANKYEDFVKKYPTLYENVDLHVKDNQYVKENNCYLCNDKSFHIFQAKLEAKLHAFIKRNTIKDYFIVNQVFSIKSHLYYIKKETNKFDIIERKIYFNTIEEEQNKNQYK